jgi:hypothetical protein
VATLWVAGLSHVDCGPPSTGQCLPEHLLSTWEAALIGLAGSAAVLAAGINVDAAVGRHRRG